MVWYNDKNVWECNGLIIEYSAIKRDIVLNSQLCTSKYNWCTNKTFKNIIKSGFFALNAFLFKF